jgi:hypothetical protein
MASQRWVEPTEEWAELVLLLAEVCSLHKPSHC